MKVKWWIKLGSAYNTEDNSGRLETSEGSDDIDSELSGTPVSQERPRKHSFTRNISWQYYH